MKSTVNVKISGIAILCLFCFSALTTAQSYSFRNYGTEYGIPNGFVYTINQTNDGFIWIGTAEGIAIFDGYEYFRVHYPDSIETRNPNTCLKDDNGNLWFGCSDGSVFRTDGRKLLKVNLKNTSSISQIAQAPDGMIYIFPQGDSVSVVNPDDFTIIRKFEVPEGNYIFCAAFESEEKILIGTQGKVMVCSMDADTIKIKEIIDEFNYSDITSISRYGKNSFLIGTAYEGIFIMKPKGAGYAVSALEGQPGEEKIRVRSVLIDEDKLWVSTEDQGVVQFTMADEKVTSFNNYNTSTGLLSNVVRTVFHDIEGNYWFGLFGDGLTMLTSDAFSFYAPGKTPRENDIIYVAKWDRNLFLGTPEGYHLFDLSSGHQVSFKSLVSETSGSQILSYFLDRSRNLWIGTAGKGLYRREPSGRTTLFYRSGDSGTDWINDIAADDNSIWLASTNGITILDKARGTRKRTIKSDDGLPGKALSRIRLEGNRAYVAAESDKLYFIDDKDSIHSFDNKMSGSTINTITGSITETGGRIWVATAGNGVFAFNGDSISSINRSNGLYSNYCYSILTDREGNIWLGHARGLSKVEKKTGIIKTFGADYIKGGKCNGAAMYETEDGIILAGTTEGLIVYDSKKDIKPELPPFNNVTAIVINDSVYSYRPVIELPFKKYKITIRYAGVNFSAPEKVYYQPYLENFDLGPGAFSTSREVTYNLGHGKYEFSLVSVDENGIANESGASFTISISKPFYQQWWFIVLAAATIFLTVVFIIRQREKAQKKLTDFLEDELSKRTSVIMQQKSEIETQNLEITDSINYAKRIQSSILPDIGKLRESFREAFILFHPRDIVSGDFYWFDKVDDERFIIVCADSTGHGVPGAFMSMIGSTLLQDIVTRKKITRPSQVLGMLDKQIFSTLNQNEDLGVANDGMDMVVCEFNPKTRHIRFASAMRPIILVMAGESYYIKGNRSSVGGESVIEKYFDDQEYYLNEGDALYFFSDGFPDQFGGIDGKKMKIARLKRLIDQISGMSMREQEETISKFFDEWRGGYEQVDDVLMMGVRV
jgi:ligand-binding sensor domain-containing protein/serine phosphatase RsbU (regulator of sigma subunit)